MNWGAAHKHRLLAQKLRKEQTPNPPSTAMEIMLHRQQSTKSASAAMTLLAQTKIQSIYRKIIHL